ncbi:unnamed protein product [Trichobilharzia regenti]|nr:unnamed protein product [Trichobilharzia regenti]
MEKSVGMRFCRTKSYVVRAPVVRALCGVTITEVERQNGEEKTKVDRRMRSRRERKEAKMQRKFEKEMAETQSLQTREKRLKMNTMVMNEILFVFFKILKTTSNSTLLSAIFKGLSKYAKLINTQYVDSLMSVLNAMVMKKVALRSLSKLLPLRQAGVAACTDNDCGSEISHLSRMSKAYDRSNTPAAQAVASLLHRYKVTENPEETTCSDEISSITANVSERIAADEVEHLTNTLISCLNMLLIKRKHEVSVNRVLAFAKRMISSALNVVSLSSDTCSYKSNGFMD